MIFGYTLTDEIDRAKFQALKNHNIADTNASHYNLTQRKFCNLIIQFHLEFN